MQKYLIEKQIALEREMTQSSIDGYLIELQKAKVKGKVSTTQGGQIAIKAMLEPLTDLIQEYIDDYTNREAVKDTIAGSIISMLPPDVMAIITIKQAIESAFLNEPFYKTISRIGTQITMELNMRKFHDKNKFYYDKITTDLKQRGANNQRRYNILRKMLREREGIETIKLTSTEINHAGLVLLELLLQISGNYIIETKIKGKKGHLERHLEATEAFKDELEEVTTKLAQLNPIMLPMVVPPNNWNTIFDGGYLSSYIRGNRMIPLKNKTPEYIELLKNSKLTKVKRALNHLQSTEWQINKKILDVVRKIEETGGNMAGLPDIQDVEPPPFPFPDIGQDRTEEEKRIIKKWKLETYEIHKNNVKIRSQRLLVTRIIKIAEKFKDFNKIYFPYQMDFRGRMYPIPVMLNPQGSDLAKGLLHFSKGLPLGDDGLNWLKIHGANLYGYDKENYEKRIEFIDNKINDIKLYAKDPLVYTDWANADHPLQFLAFCMELNDYLDNPDDFVSHLPIQLDGTCNGLQHYSALLRNEVQAKSVNVSPTEKPADIYSVVADKLVEKLKASPELLAHKWLELGINRKLTKRPVMVLPYGGTIISTREYIEQYLTENYSAEFITNHFESGGNYKNVLFKVTNWLSKLLWESIKDVVPAAIKGMEYIKKVAALIKGKPLRWTTPLELPIEQAYEAMGKKIVVTELYGKIYKTRTRENKGKPDPRKQQNGICPNFIHSLDAACLMLYLNKCKDNRIYNFNTVHDSYGTYACFTTESAKLLREAFIEIYRRPILDDFTYDVLENAGYEGEYPKKPEIGNLDIEQVKNSKYFFN